MHRSDRTTVLYIGGCGRSGSTLLDRMMGEVPGFFSVGEVVHIWRRGVQGNELCACGEPFHECPFWLEVGLEAFGGWGRLDVPRALALQRSVDRSRYIPWMLAPGLHARYRLRMRAYLELLGRLYAAIRSVSGAQVLVDSSKHASYAFLMRRLPNVDLRVIHLVRDSYGVAFSMRKHVERPEVPGKGVVMPTLHPVRSGIEWLAFNSLFHLLGSSGVRTLPVRYESVVSDPRDELARIVAWMERRADDVALGFVRDHTVTLSPTHTVAGNPMRFRQGDIELRLDDEWRRRMPGRDRAVTAAITWPLRLAYGYGGRGGTA